MTNKERMQSYIVEQRRPLIVYDVETTGCMDGSDNRITQIALAAYEYNRINGKYELQDHMFMLAKPNKASLSNIEARQKVTNENITNLLKEEYVYNYTNDIKREITNCERRQKTLVGKIAKATEKYGADSKEVEKYKEQLEKEKGTERMFSSVLSDREDTVKNNYYVLVNSIECQEYVKNYFPVKKLQLEEAISLKDILSSQGINLDTWRKGNDGLSFGEIQIGINKFLKSYEKDNTIFLSNGSYFSKHYMDKEKLKLNDSKEEIDVPKTFGQKDWSYSLSTICKDYEKQTGKVIQHFDALTKALCMVEMVGSITNVEFQNTSKRYLEEQVKWEAAKEKNDDYEEDDYVITMSQLERSHIVMDIPRYDKYVPVFNSLEYIDFGSERRYVDIDRMFEVNDNFEVTLEGEKDPIKTWEELEAKIKALNGEVSSELLNRIHEKYDEIREKALKDYSFSEAFYEQEEEEYYDEEFYREEEMYLNEDCEKADVVETKEVDKPSNIDKMLASLFEKNAKLEELQKQSAKMSEELQQKEETLFNNKMNAIVQNLVGLQNIFATLKLTCFEIPSESLERYFYNVNNRSITISKSLSGDTNNWSKPIKDKFLKDVSDHWDKIYERTLATLEKQVETKIQQDEKLVEGLQKSLEEMDDLLDLEM